MQQIAYIEIFSVMCKTKSQCDANEWIATSLTAAHRQYSVKDVQQDKSRRDTENTEYKE